MLATACYYMSYTYLDSILDPQILRLHFSSKICAIVCSSVSSPRCLVPSHPCDVGGIVSGKLDVVSPLKRGFKRIHFLTFISKIWSNRHWSLLVKCHLSAIPLRRSNVVTKDSRKFCDGCRTCSIATYIHELIYFDHSTTERNGS